MREQYLVSASNNSYLSPQNISCGFPSEESFHIFRSASDDSYPWTGMVFGVTILAINAWCTDQVGYINSF